MLLDHMAQHARQAEKFDLAKMLARKSEESKQHADLLRKAAFAQDALNSDEFEEKESKTELENTHNRITDPTVMLRHEMDDDYRRLEDYCDLRWPGINRLLLLTEGRNLIVVQQISTVLVNRDTADSIYLLSISTAT